MMIATGRVEGERGLAAEPKVAQFVEARATDHQALGGGVGSELAGIEGGQDLLDIEGLDAMSELWFFIGDGK